MGGISGFGQINSAQGFVQSAADGGLKQSTGSSFLGRAISFIFHGNENKQVKADFIKHLDQTFGAGFGERAKAMVDVESRKPLEARTVRDLLALAPDAKASRQMENAESRIGTPKSDQDHARAAARALDSLNVGSGPNFFARALTVVNADSEAHEKGFKILSETSPQASAYAGALTDYFRVDTGKLQDYYKKPCGDEGRTVLDVLSDGIGKSADRFNMKVDISRIKSDLIIAGGQFGTRHEMMFGNILKAARDDQEGSKLNHLKMAANEGVVVINKQIETMRIGASVLTDPDFLLGLPEETRSEFRELGKICANMLDQMTRPDGPVQDFVSLCVRAQGDPGGTMAELQAEMRSAAFRL